MPSAEKVIDSSELMKDAGVLIPRGVESLGEGGHHALGVIRRIRPPRFVPPVVLPLVMIGTSGLVTGS